MKVKVELVTWQDVFDFANITSSVKENVYLTDGNSLKVSAKSFLGAAYTMEWNDVYCESDADIYTKIERFVVI